jgi:hypothetical protein
MHLAHLVDLSSVIKDELGDGRLAGVDVSGDSNIPYLAEVA